MRFIRLAWYRKALCSLLSWGSLTCVLLLGASVVYVLLLPVARDIALRGNAPDRGEIRTGSTELLPHLPPGIPANASPSFWIEPSPDESSRDVDVARVR